VATAAVVGVVAVAYILAVVEDTLVAVARTLVAVVHASGVHTLAVARAAASGSAADRRHLALSRTRIRVAMSPAQTSAVTTDRWRVATAETELPAVRRGLIPIGMGGTRHATQHAMRE
jgi:hypothetical protein